MKGLLTEKERRELWKKREYYRTHREEENRVCVKRDAYDKLAKQEIHPRGVLMDYKPEDYIIDDRPFDLSQYSEEEILEMLLHYFTLEELIECGF